MAARWRRLWEATGRQLRPHSVTSPYGTDSGSMTVGSVWLALVRRWALWLVLLEILVMLSSPVRRSLLSLLTVSTVGTLGFSAAASLDVSTAELGAGEAQVAACVAGLSVDYASTYLADNSVGENGGRYFVTSVELNDTGLADCQGQDVSVTLVGADGESLHEATDKIADAATTTITFPSDFSSEEHEPVPAADVLHVAVMIAGFEATGAE